METDFSRCLRRLGPAFLPHVVLLLVAGVLVAACGGSSSSTDLSVPNPSFSTAIRAGMTVLKQGNANAAQQLFADAVKSQPRNPTGYFDEGVAYQQEGQKRNALIAYVEALKQDPNFVPAEFNRAVLYATSDPTEAVFLYRKVIALQHDSPTAYLNLGLLEAKQGQSAAARADLAKAVELQPSLAAQIPASVQAGLAGAAPPTTRPHFGVGPATTTTSS